MKPTLSFRLGGKFHHLFLDGFSDFRQASCSGTVGKLVVVPEVLEHFDQMTFPTAVKAAHPHAWLLGFIQIRQVTTQDAFQALGILTIAHEVRDLIAERLQLMRFNPAGDLGHSLVQQLVQARIFFVDLAVDHDRISPSCAVIGTAR